MIANCTCWILVVGPRRRKRGGSRNRRCSPSDSYDAKSLSEMRLYTIYRTVLGTEVRLRCEISHKVEMSSLWFTACI